MKKKVYLILILILLIFTFTSCKYAIAEKKLITASKENKFYYTNLLTRNITNESNYKCIIMDTNFHKEKVITSSDMSIVTNFIKSLNSKSFINPPKDLDKNPKYKIFTIFSKDKYVINIYNNKYIGLHPWDGYYEMDYIDMSNIPTSYNLYNLCSYIIPRE